MLPDLRFVLGALIATALLGVTLFGLAATMHISYQSKIGPLEASRMLAYTSEGRHRIFEISAPRADSPFANIPADPNPVPLRQQSLEPTAEPEAEAAAVPVQTAASVPTASVPPAIEQPTIIPAASVPPAPEPVVVQPANLPPPADDADTVDERAVVDPPLPRDSDPPAQTVETAPAAPLPEPEPEPAAASAPIETMPAAPAPVVEAPPESVGTPDFEQVASIPPAATDAAPETRPDIAALTEAREAPKARRARKAARAKRAVRRAAATPTLSQSSTLFPLSSTSNRNQPAIGFWPHY